MSHSTPVRVALIGCGGIVSKTHLPCLLELRDEARIVGVADPVAGLRDAAGAAAGVRAEGRFDDFPAMLAATKPQLVLVATPHHLHAAAVSAAARGGAGIVCEKPISAHVAEAAEIVGIIDAAGVPFSVVHNFLYSPGNIAARRLLAGRNTGRVCFSRAQSLFAKEEPLDRTAWRNRVETGGGSLNDTCYHEIYQVEALVGAPVQRVQARIATVLHDVPVDDLVLLQFEHADGTLSTVTTSWAVPGFEGTFCEVHTTSHSLRVEGRGRKLRTYDRATRRWEEVPVGPVDAPGVASGHLGFWRATLEAFRAGQPLPVPPRRALRQVAILEAARESSRRGGEPVEVEPFGAPASPHA